MTEHELQNFVGCFGLLLFIRFVLVPLFHLMTDVRP